MQLFIVFILGAVLLGAGSMLSPAWRTVQPRIALSAALCLALVVGGAVFYAEAFGWDTLVVDYLLFALMSGVVLGGTLSNAQARAEAKGETLSDEEQGWPGPQDLAFLTVVGIIILIPLLNLSAPLGAHGQQLGFQTLIIRFGESFTSLAPFYPETTVIYSPGFHAFSAYLSQQLGQSIPMIHMSIAAIVVYLCVWLAYDIGAEFQDKRLGRAMAIAMLLSGGIFISYLDGHDTELMGLLFTMAFLLYAIRFLREFSWADMVAGGLMMGAVMYTNLTMSVVLILGFIPLAIMVWLIPDANTTRKSQLGLTFGFPLVAFIGISPWLIKNLSLMFPIVPSPFTPEIGLLSTMIIGQGVVIIPLAIWGAVVGLRNKTNYTIRFLTIWMLVWLLLVIEFSLFGFIGRIIPFLGDLVNAPNLARHGVILPVVWLGGLAILNLWETRLSSTLQSQLRNQAYVYIAATGIFILAVGFAFNPMIDVMRDVFSLPPTTATSDDIEAMTWLKTNAPQDAVLYAVDGNAWLPVYGERNAIDFRAVQYFEWDPIVPPDAIDEFNVDTLDTAPFDYVFVSSNTLQDLDAVDSLDLVYEAGKAKVYRLFKQ